MTISEILLRAESQCSRKGRSLGVSVHPQEAITEVDKTLGLVSDELGSDLIQPAAALDDAAGGAQNAHVFRSQVRGLADAFGELNDHELVAVGQLAQDAPADGAVEDFGGFIERDRGRRRWRGSLGV